MLDFQIPRITSRDRRGEPRLVHDRAARSRLRLHVRQLAAARAAVVARRRRRHERAHRGRRARVLDDQGRQGGRHRHRPQPQGHRLPHALRRRPRSRRRWSSPAPARSPPRTSTCPPASRSSTRTSHIATLEKKTKLELYLTIGRGRGYRPAEDNKSPDQPIGVIPIDSIFSPVRARGLRGRAGARRPADRLRQAHARHRDRRLDRPAGRAARGRRDPDLARWRSSPTPTASRSCAPAGRRRARRRRRRRRGAAAAGGRRRRPDGRHPHRGARARRALVQLPQARRHPDRRRPHLQVRGRAQRDPELRQEVDRRGHRDAHARGLGLRDD